MYSFVCACVRASDQAAGAKADSANEVLVTVLLKEGDELAKKTREECESGGGARDKRTWESEAADGGNEEARADMGLQISGRREGKCVAVVGGLGQPGRGVAQTSVSQDSRCDGVTPAIFAPDTTLCQCRPPPLPSRRRQVAPKATPAGDGKCSSRFRSVPGLHPPCPCLGMLAPTPAGKVTLSFWYGTKRPKLRWNGCTRYPLLTSTRTKGRKAGCGRGRGHGAGRRSPIVSCGSWQGAPRPLCFRSLTDRGVRVAALALAQEHLGAARRIAGGRSVYPKTEDSALAEGSSRYSGAHEIASQFLAVNRARHPQLALAIRDQRRHSMTVSWGRSALTASQNTSDTGGKRTCRCVNFRGAGKTDAIGPHPSWLQRE